MIRFFAKRRFRKGFTLTETIVVVALMAIIMACVVAFGSPVRGMVKNAAAKNDALTINKIIGDYIERQLSFANSMEIMIGYKYDMTGTETTNPLLKKFKDCANNKDDKNTPGVLVLHFDEGTSTSEENSFKLYNYTIKAKTETSLPALTDLMNDCAVFTDDFYAGYNFFITTDDITVGANASNKAYLTFTLQSYDLDNDHPLTSADIVSHYYKMLHLTEDAVKDNFVEDTDGKFAAGKLAFDKSAFAVENIKGKEELVEIKDASNNVTGYSINSTPPSLAITRNTADVADLGNDVFIFYNIKKYDSTT